MWRVVSFSLFALALHKTPACSQDKAATGNKQENKGRKRGCPGVPSTFLSPHPHPILLSFSLAEEANPDNGVFTPVDEREGSPGRKIAEMTPFC